MGTVKLNNDVRTSVRGELGSSPRILLWTTQNRPTLPQFPDWGSGVFLGEWHVWHVRRLGRTSATQAPHLETLVAQGFEACEAGEALWLGVYRPPRSGGGGTEYHLPTFCFPTKVKNKRLKRLTRLKALQDKGFVGGALFAQVPHVPPKRHPSATRLTAPTNRAGPSIEPAPVSLYSLQSLQLPPSYCYATTQPIEDITIEGNNGHITIGLNTIELQSIFF